MKESCRNYVITTFWWCTGSFSPTWSNSSTPLQPSMGWASSTVAGSRQSNTVEVPPLLLKSGVFSSNSLSGDRVPGLKRFINASAVGWLLAEASRQLWRASDGISTVITACLWRHRCWFNGEYQQKKTQTNKKKSLKKREKKKTWGWETAATNFIIAVS